ncbi:60S ribosome subunit biogenesis protein Nop8p [Trichomonascus vanleenenianus]|uniref:Nop8p n=1 Tax=Trichomonascus vanleenenianus TaxID=2268995 RepID=UPI003ECA430F
MPPVRLHLGGISESLAGDLDEFRKRLAKFGEIQKDIELHRKLVGDTCFGFVTIDLEPKQLDDLRAKYHNVSYKGSRLTITVAKPDYKEWLEKDRSRPDPKPSHDELKRMYSTPPREIDVIPGCLRVTPRQNLYNATYRILKKGKPVILRLKKQKLWGILNKNLEDLVWSYENGQWKDGQGGVIETVDYEHVLNEAVDNDSEPAEASRDLKILEDMFGGDFDEDIRMALSDDDDEEVEQVKKSSVDLEYNKHSESEVEIDKEEFDESKIPAVSTSVLRSVFNESAEKDSNKAFSGFGGPSFGVDDDESGGGGGGLFGGLINEDEIEEQENEEEVELPTVDSIRAEREKKEQDQGIVPRKAPRGLFFAHSDSPFLFAQSQFARLTCTPFDKTAWEEEFWAKRGEWNRELRRRRREVTRLIRKKNQSKGAKA